MKRTSEQVNKDIRQIDRRIDGIRLELFRRCGRFNTMSSDEWQLAWDRNPDLDARHYALFDQRGSLQVERDAALNREYDAVQRRQRRQYRKAA